MSPTKKYASGLMLCAGLAMSIATAVQAQPVFQSIFPPGLKQDAARGGVLHTGDGGSITVGQSESFGSGSSDVYVIKTDECGFLQWSTTYDLGGYDVGRKIRETDNGGYIIVGSTENTNNCCSRNDIFLLEIDAKGGVVWAKTYGGAYTDDGYDVQSYFGKGYVVAGSTSSYGFGKINGYLMMTDLNGDVQWANSYGGDRVEEFFSCAVIPQGDIWAAGYSESYTKDSDIFLVRTDGNGTVNLGNAHVYPSPGQDQARCVIAVNKDEALVAGFISGATGTQDGYLLWTDGGGTPLGQKAYAEAYEKFDDQLAEVRETQYGTFIVTGYLTNAPGGLGGQDLYLSEVEGNSNPYNLGILWSSVHGSKGDEQGYSVAFDPTGKYARYTAAGFTNTFTGTEDVYLIRAEEYGKTGCYDSQPKVLEIYTKLYNKDFELPTPHAVAYCATKVPYLYHKDGKVLCTTCKSAMPGTADPNLGNSEQVIGNDVTVGVNQDIQNTQPTSGQVSRERLDR